MSQKNHAAKFAFFYLLSLIALVFVALAVGMIVFQIINKEIIDLINDYSGRYSDGTMRFAISSIIIATPIYYISTRQIYKNLYEGKLNPESGVRKWLTYLILLVSIVVMIGWLIGTINSFLEGELTIKAILKSLTALLISGGIFSFYLYDIRREKIQEYKDKVIRISFFVSLFVILAVFVAALFIVDSPQEVRKRKMDERIINNFYTIDSAIGDYYNSEGSLPTSLDVLVEELDYLSDKDLSNPIDNKSYTYNVVDDKKYELCTTFQSSNKEQEEQESYYRPYYDTEWLHDSGYQCLEKKVKYYEAPDKPVIIQ